MQSRDLLLALGIALAAQAANAATFHLVTSDSLVGRSPGGDDVFGGADDEVLPVLNDAVLNTHGALSSFRMQTGETVRWFGFTIGSFEVGTPGAQLLTGANSWNSASMFSEQNRYDPTSSPPVSVDFVNNTLPFGLAPGTSSYTQFQPLGSFDPNTPSVPWLRSSYRLSTGGLPFEFTGNGLYFTPGDDRAALIAAAAAAHVVDESLVDAYIAYANLIAQDAPTDWTLIAFERYTFNDMAGLGFSGGGVSAYYSTDPLAVPAPVPLPAPLILLGSALGVLGATRRRPG